MSTELARREPELRLTNEQVALVKRSIAKDHSDDELALFINQCNRTGLDPFARQIYSIKRGGVAQVQVSIDGARLVAERTGRYRPGHTYYYDANGDEKSVWLSDDAPSAARVTVFKDGHEVPGIPVRWKERVQGTNAWKTMPATMLAKCAEMATLRQAFPQDLSGLYSAEEIGASEDFTYPVTPAIEAPKNETFVAPTGAKATKAQVAELETALDQRAQNSDTSRDVVDDWLRTTYGTANPAELSKAQATELLERVKTS